MGCVREGDGMGEGRGWELGECSEGLRGSVSGDVVMTLASIQIHTLVLRSSI